MTAAPVTTNNLLLKPLALCLSICMAGGTQAGATESGYTPQRTGHRPQPRTERASPVHLTALTAVTNCNDSGAGSLRAAVGMAASNTLIDLTQLPCSTITLTTGALPVSSLIIKGPGVGLLTIDGNSLFPVFQHTDAGTLAISNMTIAYGNETSAIAPKGGCIYSAGTVYLDHALVEHCLAKSTGNVPAHGGGIFAAGAVILSESTVTGCTVESSGANGPSGGGVEAANLYAYYSTISNNAVDVSVEDGFGGGIVVRGSAILKQSTISGNVARAVGGMMSAQLPTDSTYIYESTFSSNRSTNSYYGAGFYTSGYAQFLNSTITANTEANPLNHVFGAGISLGSAGQVYLQSCVIAGNAIDTPSGVFPSDINGVGTANILGSHNLMGVSILTAPVDTLFANPKLGPLANNGGPTATHALLLNSPAIGAGINLHFAYDQRGIGFNRTVGVSPDIGAFERQGGVDDLIFRDSFEPPL